MTVTEFAKKVEQGDIAGLVKHKLDSEANIIQSKTHIHQGKKWTRIDVGTSGRYMINAEGQIYGIKAYGVPHLGHYHGTLENPSEGCFGGR